MKKLLLAGLLLVLAACATGQTPAQKVYAIQGNYNAALSIAVAYQKLPDCVEGGPTLCKKDSVVEELQRADKVAYPVLQGAQEVVRDPGATATDQVVRAAEAAVRALTSITSTLQIGGAP
jgi:hypothetical protein